MAREVTVAKERHPAESADRMALIRVAAAAQAYRDHEEGEPDMGEAHIKWESALYQRQQDLDDAMREAFRGR